MSSAYSVAILTRGTGAYVYTYSSSESLGRGTLCALSFRGSLEIGVVLSVDEDPPDKSKLLPLIPVAMAGNETWGELLCDLAALFAATPREVAGYLLFSSPNQGLKLAMTLLDATSLPAKVKGKLAGHCGQLTPARKKKLMADVSWDVLHKGTSSGAVKLEVAVAALPGVTRPQGKYAKSYSVDPTTAKLLGLKVSPDQSVPGTYLTGLANDLDALNLTIAKPDVDEHTSKLPAAHESKLDWQSLDWPTGWEVLSRCEGIAKVRLRRTMSTWDHLRGPRGLPAELAGAIQSGERTLVIAPMAWMLERIWPVLGLWAGHVHRFRSESSPSAVSAVLSAVQKPGQIVCGLEGAWKLAAYCKFDRVILIDPTHPSYEPEGAPWLDPRMALWRVLAGSGTNLDVVEMGLSAFDGATQLRQAAVMPPHVQERGSSIEGNHADIDPLPLHLRQPGRRRLVFFNRLGQGRNLRCAECGQGANCPQCSSISVHFSGQKGYYNCPECGWRHDDLLCRNCGTATLSSGLPGLEALTRREGDALVEAGKSGTGAHPETRSVFGTAKLLEPIAEFWPQEVVYVHADAKPGLMDDWHTAVDQVARLCALYANPQLQYAYIVSAHLRGKLGNSLTRGQAASSFNQDMKLRSLAGLPPYGRLLRFRWRSQDRQKVSNSAKAMMKQIGQSMPDAMLGLGKPYRRRDGFCAVGYAVNPTISDMELQRMRFSYPGVAVSVHVICGPWDS